jgi:hypothetical protein
MSYCMQLTMKLSDIQDKQAQLKTLAPADAEREGLWERVRAILHISWPVAELPLM